MKLKRFYMVTRVVKETACVEATSAAEALLIINNGEGSSWDVEVVSEKAKRAVAKGGE